MVVIAALLVVQCPPFQKKMADKFLEGLNEKCDGEISFSKIHFRPFKTLVIRDLCIVDKNPQSPLPEVMEKLGIDSYTPRDTLLSAGYVIAKMSLKTVSTLADGNGVHLDKLFLRDAHINLVVEEGRLTNLQRMFGIPPSTGLRKEHTKDVLEIDKAVLKNVRYSMQIIRKKRPKERPCINWTDLDVSDIQAQASNIRLSKGIMTGTLESCSFREKSGCVVDNVSGSTAVGNGQAVIENIHILAGDTDLSAHHYTMSYDEPKSFRNYNDSVRMDIKINPSKLDLGTLGYFVPALNGLHGDFIVSGEAEGGFPSMYINGIDISTADRSVTAHLAGTVEGLPKVENITADIFLDNCSGTVKAVERMVSGITGKKMSFAAKAPSARLDVNAHAKGRLNDLDAFATVKSAIGSVKADLNIKDLLVKENELLITGDIETDRLNVSKLVKTDLVGECTMKTTLSASLRGEDGPSLSIDPASISKLNVYGYDYTRLTAKGTFSKEKFDGRIVSQDPNLNFMFQGIFTLAPKTRNSVYQFFANVGYANLQALNIDKRDGSNAAFRVNADFNHAVNGDLSGTVKVSDIRLGVDEHKYNLGTVLVKSDSKAGDHSMSLTSSFAEATFKGTNTVGQFVKDLVELTAVKELPSLFSDRASTRKNDAYELTCKCIKTKDITAFFKPGLYIDNNTSLNMSVSKDGIVSGNLNSHRIALKDQYFKALDCTFDNKDNNLSGDILCDEVKVGAFILEDNRIRLFADNNGMAVDFTSSENADSQRAGLIGASSDFHAHGAVSRGRDDQIDLNVSIMPSGLKFGEDRWNIMPAKVDIKSGDIDIRKMHIANGQQDLTINGGLSKSHSDTLSVRLSKFNLATLNPFMGKSGFDLGGKATGKVFITSSAESSKGLLLNLNVDSTSFAGTPIGTLHAVSSWNDEEQCMDINLDNRIDSRSSINAKGRYWPSDKKIDLVAGLDKFNAGVTKPLFKNVFSEIDGYLSGSIRVSGPLDAINIAGENTRFDKTLLTLEYTNVPYIADGPFEIDNHGMRFTDVTLTDWSNGTGKVGGGITWDRFKNIALNTVINVENMECMNIPESRNEPFYGRLFGTGQVNLTGPVRSLNIGVDVTTSGPGDLHIPTSSSGKTSSNLLRFKEREKVVILDDYEMMMSDLQKEEKAKTDLNIKIKAQATRDVTAFLEVDKATGNMLSGIGDGLIEIEVRPSRSIFNLKGDYTISDGSYTFVALGIAKRDFDIKEGSSIKFNGAVSDSDLNIDAIYKTKTSIATLISDDSSVNSRRLVECGIQITDKLKNPKLGFSIDIPDLNPAIQSQVDNALSTEDKIQKQFLSLVISNSFLPDEASGIVNNTSILYSNVAEIMSNQLNNIFQKLEIPVDLGLSYQPNEKGRDIFDVAVSTQLFNNRVLINGNIGNRQYSNGASNSDIAGDIDIAIKIDRSGALRLNLFSHSADQYTNYLDNSQRNGLGLTYQQEFNNFEDMFKRMFAGKKKREKLDQEEQERMKAEGMKVIKVE